MGDIADSFGPRQRPCVADGVSAAIRSWLYLRREYSEVDAEHLHQVLEYQLDNAWSLTRLNLTDLDDECALWEPAQPVWTVRPSADGWAAGLVRSGTQAGPNGDHRLAHLAHLLLVDDGH